MCWLGVPIFCTVENLCIAYSYKAHCDWGSFRSVAHQSLLAFTGETRRKTQALLLSSLPSSISEDRRICYLEDQTRQKYIGEREKKCYRGSKEDGKHLIQGLGMVS